ncbi:MAG TPA: hypothetical protein VEI97_05170 [bacterium]|nr:hypothetical protein [bacterium]
MTYLLEILRGIILRGAVWADLTDEALILTVMMGSLLALSVQNFRKTLE